MKTILLLEDDLNLNHGITLKLKKEGYQVLSAFGVSEAENFINNYEIDLIISDITLPEGNGMDFCAEVRKKSSIYIIFLTALDSELDIVNAYDIGADDYITKPFSLIVLISKVNALMRRIDGIDKSGIQSGEIRVSYKDMKAYKSGELMSLSKKELRLLLYLMENAGQLVTKEQILAGVWDVDGQFVDDNTVPVNISRLRTKVGNDYIQNVRGMGYLWIKESTKE